MDYGPFGWIEQYDPLFAKWTGSGEHFAFMNQPQAAVANYYTLVASVMPVLSRDPQEASEKAKILAQQGAERIHGAAKLVWCAKMGFEMDKAESADAAAVLWQSLEPLMRRSRIDYTLFWRQLAAVISTSGSSDPQLFSCIEKTFYEAPSDDLVAQWNAWLQHWLTALNLRGRSDKEKAVDRLCRSNPKYVPREWMLVEAYEQAAHGDYKLVHELFELFLRPYDEQLKFEDRYYRRAPPAALSKGGCAHMS